MNLKVSDFETLDKKLLARILRRFYVEAISINTSLSQRSYVHNYVEARNAHGDHYKIATLNAIQAGRTQQILEMTLKSEYQGAELIDIIKDSEFVQVNEANKAATVVELKKMGKEM